MKRQTCRTTSPCFSKCETVPLLSRHALPLASCVLFCCVGDEADNKEKGSQVCEEEEDDDDDPENRYIKTNCTDNLDWILTVYWNYSASVCTLVTVFSL